MIPTKKNAVISGLGCYVPERILTNSDLEDMVETSDEWIKTRTGIEQRRISADDQFTSDVASKAAIEALKDAKIDPSEVDLIIVATVTPDMFSPSVSCLVQQNIKAVNAAAFDINAACSGFVYAVSVANQFISTGYYKNILVIGADVLSKITDWKDRNTCVLFGDGAGAVIVTSETSGYEILSTHIGSDGTLGKHLTIPALKMDEQELAKRDTNHPMTIWMDGSEVFKFAVRKMAMATLTVLDDIGKNIEDVDAIIPHQANLRIIDGAAKRLKFPKDKIFTNLNKLGNMSAASIPVAFYEAVKTGFIKEEDLIVLVGFGGGLTWSSAALKWREQ